MTLEYVAMWVPAESLNSCQELGARLLEPSTIRQALVDSTPDSASMPGHGIKESSGDLGWPPDDLEYLAMTSDSPLITPALELYYLPKSDVPMPSSGKKLRLVWDKSQESTQKKPSATSSPYTDGAA